MILYTSYESSCLGRNITLMASFKILTIFKLMCDFSKAG